MKEDTDTIKHTDTAEAGSEKFSAQVVNFAKRFTKGYKQVFNEMVNTSGGGLGMLVVAAAAPVVVPLTIGAYAVANAVRRAAKAAGNISKKTEMDAPAAAASVASTTTNRAGTRTCEDSKGEKSLSRYC